MARAQTPTDRDSDDVLLHSVEVPLLVRDPETALAMLGGIERVSAAATAAACAISARAVLGGGSTSGSSGGGIAGGSGVGVDVGGPAGLTLHLDPPGSSGRSALAHPLQVGEREERQSELGVRVRQPSPAIASLCKLTASRSPTKCAMLSTWSA